MKEPTIIINGAELTDAQAMTVRVAVTSFAIEMNEPNALGVGGDPLAKAYSQQATVILSRMKGSD